MPELAGARGLPACTERGLKGRAHVALSFKTVSAGATPPHFLISSS